VSFWAEVFLGIIAFATLTMAVIQVAAIVYGWSVARRLNRLLSQIEQEMRLFSQNLNAIARDASRISSLALGQVERLDRLLTDVTTRLEEAATAMQNAVVKPLREGAAMMAGIRAVIEVFRDLPRRSGGSRPRAEEEETLFIG
jgi:hypothetical protein